MKQNDEKCKHEPVLIVISGWEKFGKVEINKEVLDALCSETRECRHCGALLKRKWEPK